MPNIKTKFSSIILAGGEGKRVGGQDKGLIKLKNKTLIQHVIHAIEPQVDEIIISANRHITTYQQYGYKVIADASKQYQGPLAGIAAALPLCLHDWVLVTPCDMPFLPVNIIEKLSSYITNSHLCIAKVDDRLQLVFLLNKRLLPSIIQALKNDQRRLIQWVETQNPAIHSFSESHCFKNVNESKDLLLPY